MTEGVDIKKGLMATIRSCIATQKTVDGISCQGLAWWSCCNADSSWFAETKLYEKR